MGEALISVDDFQNYLTKYNDVARVARTDLTPESDLIAARLAPIVFLVNLKGFEATFDLVVHHYEQALKKAGSKNTQLSISRECEEMFHLHIYTLQLKIEDMKSKMRESMWGKAKSSFKQILVGIRDFFLTSLTGMEDIVDGTIDMLSLYFEKIRFEWRVKEEEAFFYLQIGHVYQKILDSQCYSGEFSLLQNTFSTNKERILPAVVQKQGMSASVDLLDFAKSSREKRDGVRIIMDALINSNRFEDILLLIPRISSMVDNMWELKQRIMQGYERSIKRKGKNTFSTIKNTLLSLAYLYVLFSCISTVFVIGLLFLVLSAFNIQSPLMVVVIFLMIFPFIIAFTSYIVQKIDRSRKIRNFGKRLDAVISGSVAYS